MRIVDKLTVEQFNGDKKAAIYYMYKNFGSKETANDYMRQFYGELNKEELRMAAEVIRQLAVERSGLEAVEKFEKSVSTMKSLNLTDEEIMNAEKNPYKAKIGKNFLKLLLVNGGLLGLTALLPNLGGNTAGIENVATTIASICTTGLAIDSGSNIMKYFKFKNAKKVLDENGVSMGGK